MMLRTLRSPSRWIWTAPVLAAGLFAACESSLDLGSQQGIWGFVTVSATQSPTGTHFTAPEGLFFQGNLSAVPNADFAFDTCADGVFSEGNNLTGVTYLDAGNAVETVVSGVTGSLNRVTTSNGTAYQPSAVPVQPR